jgi:hypothetical protein
MEGWGTLVELKTIVGEEHSVKVLAQGDMLQWLHAPSLAAVVGRAFQKPMKLLDT